MMFVCGQLQSIRGLGNRMIRNRAFLQDLTILKLVNRFSAYCAKQSLLSCLSEPAIGGCSVHTVTFSLSKIHPNIVLFVCLLGVRGKTRMYCSLLAYCTARFGRSNFRPSDAPAPTDAFRTLAAEVATYGPSVRTGNFA
jgi:hypothetical protein